MSDDPDLVALMTVPYDAKEDAYKLKDIMTDGRYEKSIILYLSSIPYKWRQEIAHVFFHEFGTDLTSDLQSILSEKYKDLILATMLHPIKYQSELLHHYLKGPAADEDLLLEILCTMSKPELADVVKTYEILFKRPLVEHLSSKTSELRRLLGHIITGARFIVPNSDTERARQSVHLLDQEGPAMWGTDEGKFVRILATESFSMIRLIFIMYKNIKGRSIENVIEDEIDGKLQDAMLAIVNCIMNPPVFLAEKLHRVLKGKDPDYNAMVRIIVNRADRDFRAVNRAFYVLYDTTITSAIEDFAEWRDTCFCKRIASWRRFVALIFKPRSAIARKVAQKILYFLLVIDDVP